MPERLAEVTSGRYPGLGLIVAIDGDNAGRDLAMARTLVDRPHRGFLAPGAASQDAPRLWKAAALEALVAGFCGPARHPELPSINDARAECTRRGR